MTTDLMAPDRARTLTAAVLAEAGLPETDAARVAAALVDTSLRGIDTHGLRLLPQYLDELATGVAVARPVLATVRDRGAGLLLDAGAALGVVAGLAAADLAAERARRYGIGAVGVRNSNHFGAASVYTRHLADQGLVGMAVTSAASRVAPYGGVQPLFGTNPISLAAGRDDEQFALDMATSQVCFGEVKHRRATGRSLEPGWVTDRDGQPTENPDDAYALSPLGGHKGHGLAMAVTLLGALLTGSPPDWRLSQVGAGEAGGRQVGHLVLAFDPDAFAGGDVFTGGLGDLLATVRSAEQAGAEPVRAPGDPQRAHAETRQDQGLKLDSRTAEILAAAAPRTEVYA